MSFVKAAFNVVKHKESISDIEEQVLNGCMAVFNKICSNAGVSDTSNIDIENNIGYNAKDNKWENLLDAGIINPAKSDRLALENAFSIVNLFLTTHCLITNEEVEF